MTTTTDVSKINLDKMTKAQFEAATKDTTHLYVITDSSEYLDNTASESTSLTILGTASTAGYSTNIGVGSSANSMGTSLGYSCGASGSPSVAIGRMVYATQSNTIGIGNMAHAYGENGIAIGTQAEVASGKTGAIQIGPGTNSNTATLSIGLYNGTTSNNYQLLDSSGNIPAERLTNALPSQTGNSGKYLTTNGTTTSWGLAFQVVTEEPTTKEDGVIYFIVEE